MGRNIPFLLEEEGGIYVSQERTSQKITHCYMLWCLGEESEQPKRSILVGNPVRKAEKESSLKEPFQGSRA